LIVEDEPEIAQLIQLSLEKKKGFSCQRSRDGLSVAGFQEQQTGLDSSST